MKILVTGGAGFIGSEFVRLSLAGVLPGLELSRCVVLDKLTYSGNRANLLPVEADPRFEFVHGDTCDEVLVNDLTEDVDVVMHFAAESHVDRSIASARPFVWTNVLGTQTIVDAVRRNGVGRLVHISTDEVYGSIDEGFWDEEAPLDPNGPYAAAKAASDLMVVSAMRTHGLDAVITRCTNNYGYYQFPEKVIPLFVTRLMEGKKVPLYGTGTNRRDWLHVSDHCRGIALAMTRGRAGQIYHIGGGTELTNLELTEFLLHATGRDWESVEFVADRQAHDRRYALDIEKISTELGYAPSRQFAEALAETVEWYRGNQWWWGPLRDRAQLSGGQGPATEEKPSAGPPPTVEAS